MTPVHDFGIVGLGTMGAALLLNIAERGFRVAGYDLDPSKVAALGQAGQHLGVSAYDDPAKFVASIRPPRPVMVLVPAGQPVDATIETLAPLLGAGDFVVDAGNSHYRDTARRIETLHSRGLGFMGLGVSGGESGARLGPCMMAGGDPADYERVRDVLEAAAARFDGQPCVARVGRGPAGHYVKMVHNGIEYAVMQLISEAADLMRRGLALDLDQIAGILDGWNQGRLGGYLLEISAQILRFREPDGLRLVEVVSDRAKAKGTGKWASQDAMDLGVPIPTIDAAVSARALSELKSERMAASSGAAKGGIPDLDGARVVVDLEGALHAAVVAAHAQGFALIKRASDEYGFEVPLETVAGIWRAGCIVRSRMLEPIKAAFARDPGLANLVLDPRLGDEVKADDEALRTTIGAFAATRVPSAAFSASLAYLDAYRSCRLPANLIQAQRDFFGAHGFERVDQAGSFHSDWGRHDLA